MSNQTTSGPRPTLSESSKGQREGELLDAAPQSDDVLVARRPSLPDASVAEEKEPFLGLSFPQLTGGALAAVVSAVAASTLGVAGTLIGAALGSVIVTVTAAAVNQGLTTAGSTLRSRQSLAAAAPAATGRTRMTTSPGRTPTETVTTHRARRVLRLPRRVWLAAAAVFAIAMIGLTLTEQVLGHPVSTSSSSGTTLGHVVNAPVDTGPSESATPSDSPAPTVSSTDEATIPDGTASAPATGAPTQSPDIPSTGLDTASPQEAPQGASTGRAETPPAPGASAGGAVVP